MRISACMMVKNEEHCLERCLKSLKDYVDEIIIVDTGSTDNTINIAKEYTDKIYFHEWEENFSKHRNQSIDYATGDWLLIIDADEEFICEATKEKLKNVLENKIPKEMNSASLIMEDMQKGKMVMKCNSARLFRKGKVYYKGIVHNQPQIDGPSAIINGLKVLHYGYDLPEDKMKAKYERSTNLLMKQYEDKENPHVEFYLCQIHGQYGNQEESRKWGKKYLAKKEELGDQFNNTVFFTLTKNYIDAGLYDDAWEVIKIWLKSDVISPDMGLAMSDFGAKVNDVNVMAVGARKYLEHITVVREKPNTLGGRFCFSNREDIEGLMLYRLMISCFQEGMIAWKHLEPKMYLLDENILQEMKKNLNILGFNHLLKEEESHSLPKLIAI